MFKKFTETKNDIEKNIANKIIEDNLTVPSIADTVKKASLKLSMKKSKSKKFVINIIYAAKKNKIQ